MVARKRLVCSVLWALLSWPLGLYTTLVFEGSQFTLKGATVLLNGLSYDNLLRRDHDVEKHHVWDVWEEVC